MPRSGPAVQHDAPGLGHQHAARGKLHLAARRRDQRRNQLVVGVMFDAEKILRVRERKRLGAGGVREWRASE
jgi:hypothetical protein